MNMAGLVTNVGGQCAVTIRGGGGRPWLPPPLCWIDRIGAGNFVVYGGPL